MKILDDKGLREAVKKGAVSRKDLERTKERLPTLDDQDPEIKLRIREIRILEKIQSTLESKLDSDNGNGKSIDYLQPLVKRMEKVVDLLYSIHSDNGNKSPTKWTFSIERNSDGYIKRVLAEKD